MKKGIKKPDLDLFKVSKKSNVERQKKKQQKKL
jgi:hypothetical protein